MKDMKKMVTPGSRSSEWNMLREAIAHPSSVDTCQAPRHGVPRARSTHLQLQLECCCAEMQFVLQQTRQPEVERLRPERSSEGVNGRAIKTGTGDWD
eukprot:441374-Rhodomonas_salina.1